MTFVRIAFAVVGMTLPALPAGAVVLAKLKTGAAELRLCPSATCPVVPAQVPGANGVVPVLEFSGNFGRVGPWMTRQEAQARFSGIDVSKLPERLALWVSRSQVTTGDPAADEAAALAALQSEKPVERPAKPRMPAKPPVPARAPRANEAGVAAATNFPAKTNAPTAFVPAPPLGAAQIASTAPTLAPLSQKIMPEPKRETASANVEATVSAPEQLTPDLLDKRLKLLPAKPNADYSMTQIVALRRQALAYLEQGSCSGIKEGGKTLTPGFLYIVCDGDEAWRQFAE